MVFDESVRQKQLDIIGSVFDINKDIDGEYEAHKLLCDTMRKLKEENNLDNFNITTYVKDNAKLKWKRNRAKKNEFVKIFTYEIDNARESYGLTRSEVLFLYALSSLLLWEENLLVDEEGLPLN